MKNLLFLFILFIIISCSPNRGVYWCGDHPCINKKEKEAYFKKTMIVEIKSSKDINYKNSSGIEKIMQEAKSKEKGRIKEKYNKPTILISLNKKIGKGSARSVVGFDIGSQIIKAVQSGIIEKGGGHKMAGGFTLKEDKIPILRDFLIKNFEKLCKDYSKNVNLYLDAIIAPSALNEDFFQEVNYLSPFGSGNSEPKFVIENIKVISSNIIGNNHIKSILCGKDGSTFKALAWNAKNTPLEPFLNKENKKRINIAGKMRLNEWKGKRNIEFMIEDISLN